MAQGCYDEKARIKENYGGRIDMVVYDICIIGAGIAGLYCARELSRKHPKAKICILEKYEFIGGRTSTFHHKVGDIEIQWEAGAGRIHKSHHNILALLKEYKLDLIPIDTSIEWRSPGVTVPIEFGRYINNLAGLKDIPQDELSKKTLKQVLENALGKARATELIDRYEYRSELDTLKADRALDVLSRELGDQGGFYVVKEGFSALVGAIKREIEKAGVKILRQHEAMDIQGSKVILKSGSPIHASKIIVALTRNDVAKFPCFKDLHILKQVKMRPLLRIYAVFPSADGRSWFSGIKKFICDPPVRYVIPMDSTKGTIMISYTDGKDAEHWMPILKKKDGLEIVKKDIMKQVRELFPEKNIPEPIYMKEFLWEDGCSYWTPGSYDFNKVSKASVVPLPDTMPNVYMCGESWAYDQCWVKCAIDQAQHCLDAIEA
jgi:glycine/D-amino acid oxidase-like deaminating enzyme